MRRLAKGLVVVAVIAAAVALLFTVVLPWVDNFIADPVMGGPPAR
jgi:hypothetical protein